MQPYCNWFTKHSIQRIQLHYVKQHYIFFFLQCKVHLVFTTTHLVGTLQCAGLCRAVKAHPCLCGSVELCGGVEMSRGVKLCGGAGRAWQRRRWGDAGGSRWGGCQARENTDCPGDPWRCSWQEVGRVDAQVGLEGNTTAEGYNSPTVSLLCAEKIN